MASTPRAPGGGASHRGLRQLLPAVRDLSPDYFALVMATGVTSTVLDLDGWTRWSAVLLWVALVAFGVLLAMTVWRVIRYRSAWLADATDPARAFALFTFPAAANVLAARLAVGDHTTVAVSLLIVGAAAWLGFGYAVPAVLIVRHGVRPALGRANGTWFMWVVATQSIAVAAASVPPSTSPLLVPLAMTCWAVGVVLYVITATLLLGALFVFPVRPSELIPAYWVFMGATAISVLAAVQLLRLPPQALVLAVAPVLAGAAVVLWAFGTWLVPLLVALLVWRHAVRRIPFGYESGLWSIVFPVAMYGAASHELGATIRVRWLLESGMAEAWVAVILWASVFLAMLLSPLRPIRRRRARAARPDADGGR